MMSSSKITKSEITELRPGNYLHPIKENLYGVNVPFFGEIIEYEEGVSGKFIFIDVHALKGLGFEELEDAEIITYYKDGLILEFEDNSFFTTISASGDNINTVDDLEYIHQIQNIYKLETGKELRFIKESDQSANFKEKTSAAGWVIYELNVLNPEDQNTVILIPVTSSGAFLTKKEAENEIEKIISNRTEDALFITLKTHGRRKK